MPAAQFLLVERESQDVFRITWRDFSGRKVEERANREQLTRRCDVLTMPDEGAEVPKMGMEHNGPRC